jgi:energy-coupling factor transport system permease protein
VTGPAGLGAETVARGGLSPRTVAAWSLAAIAVVLLTNNPVYRGLVALVALNLLVARRRPGISLGRMVGFLSAFALFTMAYNPLISHGGAHVLFRIPEAMAGIGGQVTLESLVFGASAALGFVSAALAVAPLMVILDPTDLLDAMPAAAHGTGTALSAALNLVPAIARSFRRVREAEALRGGSRRGPLAMLGAVVPVTLTTIESSITLAEAMEARAYGSGPRTRYRQSRLGVTDSLVMLCAAAAVCALLGARLLAVPLDWYPFPSVRPPAVNPLVVGACLLLAAPLVSPPPRRSPGRLQALA